MWLHATVVSAWRVFPQPLCLLLHSTAGFLAAPTRWWEVTHIMLFKGSVYLIGGATMLEVGRSSGFLLS